MKIDEVLYFQWAKSGLGAKFMVLLQYKEEINFKL